MIQRLGCFAGPRKSETPVPEVLNAAETGL